MTKKKYIVARYREDLAWLDRIRDHQDTVDVVVYDKSQYYLNVGREAETFARGILDSWDDMVRARATHLVFLQGNPFDHVSMEAIIDAPASPEVVPLGKMHESDAHGYPDHPRLPIGAMWSVLGQDPRASWSFVAGAQYIVPADHILRHGYAFWQRVHGLLYEERLCAWTMERFWYHLFC